MENEISKINTEVSKESDYIDLIDTNFAPYRSGDINQVLEAHAASYFKQDLYRPDSRGLKEAREAIAGYYLKDGMDIDPERVFITASTSESYTFIFNTLSGEDSEVMLPNPGYPLFEYIAGFTHLKPVYYPLLEKENWQPDVKFIEANITPSTKFIVAITPNNPTGSVTSENNLQKIFDLAEKHHITVIIDEVFKDFTYLTSKVCYSPDRIKTPLFLLNGISKTLALPDMKLAWFYCNSEVNEDMLDTLELSNDCYLNANYFSQSCLSELLPLKDTISEPVNQLLKANAQTLAAFLRDESDIFSGNLPVAGIHAVISLNIHQDEEALVLGLLKEKHLNVHPGYFYDYESQKPHLVISLLKNKENFTKGLSRIRDYVIEYKRIH